jgi:hypothetical protein
MPGPLVNGAGLRYPELHYGGLLVLFGLFFRRCEAFEAF